MNSDAFSFKEEEGMRYAHSLSIMAATTTRLELTFIHPSGCYVEDEISKDRIKTVVDLLPELGGFVIEHNKASTMRLLPAKQIVDLLSDGRFSLQNEGGVLSQVIIDMGKYWARICFPELCDMAYSGHPGNVKKVKKSELGDGRPIEEFPNAFSVDRSGHDGIANGGSWGIYHKIYTDGKVKTKHTNDRSVSQHGHRVNYHHDEYNVIVELVGATWAIVIHDHQSQLYDYKSEWEIFGHPPDNWKLVRPVVI